MSTLMNQGYIDLLAKKTAVGSGTTEPTGIFTGHSNQTMTPAHVVVKTAGFARRCRRPDRMVDAS